MFRYSTITADSLEVEAGKPFTIQVASKSALPFAVDNSAAAPVEGAEIFRSTAAESAEAAASEYTGYETFAVTDANGEAEITLYYEGYTLLNAYRMDDEGRYIVGSPILVHVNKANDLSAIKQQLRKELDEVYNDENYPESIFTSENWQALQKAYEDGVKGIEEAENAGDASTAQETAIQEIKRLKKSAASGNDANLKTFRQLLSTLPEDVSKLDENAADTIEKLKKSL